MDRTLLLNSIVHGGVGIAAIVVPARVGWALYENEGATSLFPPFLLDLRSSSGASLIQFNIFIFTINQLPS